MYKTIGLEEGKPVGLLESDSTGEYTAKLQR